MNREFLEFYNRELAVLREQAVEFAAEYPGIADRLGGVVGDRLDPMIGGLLEGAAFLAARVQLKLKHEFSDFTVNLIDQLAPQYLAPLPSFVLVQAAPKFGDPALREGRKIAANSYFDATYREAERNVACRFRLASPIALWPLEVVKAEYLSSSAQLQALTPGVAVEGAAALRLQLQVRAAARAEDEPADKEAHARPELQLASCRIDGLRFHLLGPEADAVLVYEQLFAHCRGVYFRMLNAVGDPVLIPGRREMVRQIGFSDDEALIPNDKRVFRGFDFLRDYFAFPRRFRGFDLVDLASVAKRLKAKSVEVIFAFDEIQPRLGSAVRKEMFALYAAPAVNLFEKTLDRIPVASNRHEYQVIPDRARPVDYETHRILQVSAHSPGAAQKTPVEPLYSAIAAVNPSGLCYTTRRLPRRVSTEERRYGRVSDYVGVETYLSLGERSDPEDLKRVSELSVKALCSNRHLAEHLPVGEGGADFRLLDDVELDLRCISGPTRPREPVMTAMFGKGDGHSPGEVAWRLINMLSLNHLGLEARGAEDSGRALRETLALFSDPADNTSERKIRGVRGLDARDIVRRVRYAQGAAAARGLEVTVTLDEKAFEGSGAFLLGAVLDRFFAEYVAVNHFTQTVVRTNERGEIMRWPPRLGVRSAL